MKNKKAFTLIELLAVIAILAIILVIAMPRVLNVIEDSAKESFRLTGESLVRKAKEKAIMGSDENFYIIEGGKFVGKNLDTNGKLPVEGAIRIREDGSIFLTAHNNKYCIKKDFEDKKVILEDNITNCNIIKPAPLSCFTYTKTISDVTITDYSNDSICPKDVIIPSTIEGLPVKIIGNSAFRENHLTSIIIPNSVTSIGGYAFTYNQLTSVTIPNSVTSMGPDSFSRNNLTNIEIPNSITTIENSTFRYNQLTSVIIPNSVMSIEGAAFADNQLTTIIIPNSVTSIGIYAFEHNQLTSVTIPNSVTSINYGAFNDNQLSDSEAFIYARKSDGSDNKTTIVSYAGSRRDNVVIPPSVTIIGRAAFSYNQLTSVTIPNSVTNIGIAAFYINQLTNITIPSGVVRIETLAFAGNQLTSVSMPSSLTYIGDGAFNVNKLPDSEAFIYARKSDGSEDKTKLVSYGGEKRDNVIIPNTVINIGYQTFLWNYISSVTIPSSVTNMEQYAFSANSLRNITISSNVTMISNSISQSFYDIYNPTKTGGTYTSTCQTCIWTKQ